MKYNIIGDIHGRTSWQDLVINDGVNIFVGDYFSPYDPISFDDQLCNYMDIIKYKVEHPETILLIGNHDEDHWHCTDSGCSRHDFANAHIIKEVLDENSEFMTAAYAIEDKAIVTHAGVSSIWYEKYVNNTKYGLVIDLSIHNDCATVNDAFSKFDNFYPKNRDLVYWKQHLYKCIDDEWVLIEYSPMEVAMSINSLWLTGKFKAFGFSDNADMYDCYGDSVSHGPMWIRPSSLIEGNLFKGKQVIQFVGHTRFPHPSRVIGDHIAYIDEIPISEHEDDKIVWCDCLGQANESVIFDSDNMSVSINIPNGKE